MIKRIFPFSLFAFLPLLLLLTNGSCQSPIDPVGQGGDEPGAFKGQVMHDMVYAVLKPDSTVWTWGGNLGAQPMRVKNMQHVVALDLSHGLGVAADVQGNLWYWGTYSIYWPAPGDQATEAKRLAYLTGVRQVSILANEVYCLRADGSVWSIPVDVKPGSELLTPTKLPGLENVRQISESLVLRKDGTLAEILPSEPAVGGLVEGIQDVVQVANVYNRRTLILKKDGAVWTWGRNDLGQLGNGTYADSAAPVAGLSAVRAISANYDFNLAVREDGTVWFWGFEGRENDTLKSRNTPVQVQGLDRVVLAYAGAHCIVLREDGSYWVFDCQRRIPQKVAFKN